MDVVDSPPPRPVRFPPNGGGGAPRRRGRTPGLRLRRDAAGLSHLATALVSFAGVAALVGGIGLFLWGATELRDRSGQAADVSDQATSTGLELVEAHVERRAEEGDVLRQTVTVAPSSASIDLHRLGLELTIDGRALNVRFGSEPGPGVFTARAILDADASFPLLQRGDLFEIAVELRPQGMEAPAGASLVQHQILDGRTVESDAFLVPAAGKSGDLVGLTRTQ